jgi:DNA-binding PadR family transcriptional regulator
MPDPTRLTEPEQQALLAVWRLGDDAYGTTLRDEIAACTGRRMSTSAIYVTLVRLERDGLVSSSMSDPTPVRGGKAKRFFRIERAGVDALKRARLDLDRLWKGLEATPEWGRTA